MATGKLGFKSFTFFMLQPFGITIEIIVSSLWRRLRHDQSNRHTSTVNARTTTQQEHYTGDTSNKSDKSLLVRCVGLIWVTLWMVWTAAYMVDVMLYGHLLPAKHMQISMKFNWL